MEEMADDDDDEVLDIVEMRRREKEADLMHADDLFGDLAGPAKEKTAKKATVVSIGPAKTGSTDDSLDLSTLPLFAPKTKADFTQLQSVLAPLLAATSSKKDYVPFVQDLAKELTRPLTSEQVRRVISTLTTLSNEKMKEEKGPAKKSKASKTKVTLNSGGRNPTGSAAKLKDDEFDDDGDE